MGALKLLPSRHPIRLENAPKYEMPSDLEAAIAAFVSDYNYTADQHSEARTHRNSDSHEWENVTWMPNLVRNFCVTMERSAGGYELHLVYLQNQLLLLAPLITLT